METNKKAKILRIYVSSTDKVKHTPVFESITFMAKRYGLAGATIYKGLNGYGPSSEFHAMTSWELMEKVPIIIEIIDDGDKILDFVSKIVPWLELLPKGCLVTTQDTDICLVHLGYHNE